MFSEGLFLMGIKSPHCVAKGKAAKLTLIFLAFSFFLSLLAWRLSRLTFHLFSRGGSNLAITSVSSTVRIIPASGNKPDSARYLVSSAVRGNPSNMNPVDLK